MKDGVREACVVWPPMSLCPPSTCPLPPHPHKVSTIRAGTYKTSRGLHQATDLFITASASLQRQRMTAEDFEPLTIIGRGAFGEVGPLLETLGNNCVLVEEVAQLQDRFATHHLGLTHGRFDHRFVVSETSSTRRLGGQALRLPPTADFPRVGGHSVLCLLV